MKMVKNYITTVIGLIIGFFLTSIIKNHYDWAVLYSLLIGAVIGGVILLSIKSEKKRIYKRFTILHEL